MTKIQFTGTGAEPHRNRKLSQINYAQCCIFVLQVLLFEIIRLSKCSRT